MALAALWVVLVAALIGAGVFSNTSKEARFGREDLIVSVTGAGAAATAAPAADAGADGVSADTTVETTDSSTDTDGASAEKTAGASDTSSDADGKTDGKTAGTKDTSAGVSDTSAGGGGASAGSGSSDKPAATAAATKKPKPTPEKQTFLFTIQCKRILDQRELWRDGLEEVIPESGVFFSGTLTYKKGETVYDALKRICQKNNILLDSKYTPLYDTYYVSGIGNLYEFDCGSESGWKYSVNGELPGVGCSKYTIHKNDKVVFFYDYKI